MTVDDAKKKAEMVVEFVRKVQTETGKWVSKVKIDEIEVDFCTLSTPDVFTIHKK